MRFAIALVTLLIAGVLVAAGIAQRTVLRPADHVSVAERMPAGVKYVVVPAAVLRAHPGRQQLQLAGAGTTFAGYGRTADVRAWLAGERYAELRVGADGAPAKPVIRTAPALKNVTTSDVVDPDGSDLWIDQRSGSRSLSWTVNLPASMSVIVAADGSLPAPSSVGVSWPVRTATPLAVPMIVAGGALAVVGLLLYVWALVHVRRRQGPRRTPPPKMPKRPQPPKYRPAPVATGPGRGRRSVRSSVAHRLVPAILAAAAVVAAALVPATTATAAVPEAPGVTEEQAHRIVDRVAELGDRADGDRDAKLLADRFAGPALDLRTAQYRIATKAGKGMKRPVPLAIPGAGADFQLILPEKTAGWPRTLFVVVKDTTSSKVAPVAVTLVQDDPRADYKAHYVMALLGKAELPTLPPATAGAARIRSDAAVLRVQPGELAADYGMLLQHTDAKAARAFDSEGDGLVEAVGEPTKKKAAKKLGSTATITFEDLPTDPASIIAMSTAASGALVSVPLEEQWRVKPKRSGVTVKPSGGTKILSKTSSTSKGIASVYGYQLLFMVPSAGSKEPVKLLGYDQGLISAKEL